MIKIYGPKQSSASRCMWLLEEAGIEYENVNVDMGKGEHKSPEYMALNPNGKVPTLVDGDFVLWESVAIMNYLVEKYAPQFGGATVEERALVNQWSLWSVIHLYHPFSTLFLQKWRNTPDSEATIAAHEELPKWLGILNAALEGKEFLVAGRFTVADLTAASVVARAEFVGVDLTIYPALHAWLTAVMARPALVKLQA
ncbi:MAG: glutathione S-transferase family protein [Candidatus Magasanikbacteria bacterium]|nr:glutathione S-transferase family protein [Candidatus Magasanikbacteria bacterium]